MFSIFPEVFPVRRSVPITYPEVWEDEPYSARLRWHRAYIPQYYNTRPHRYRIEMQEAGSTANDWKPVATGLDSTEHTVNNISPRKDYNFRIRAELENGDFSEPTPPIQYHRTKLDDKPLSKELSENEDIVKDKTMDTDVNGPEPIPKDIDRPISKDRPSIDNLTKEFDRPLATDRNDIHLDESLNDNEQPKPKRKSRFLEKVRARRDSLNTNGEGNVDLLKDNDKPKRKSRFLSKDRSKKDIVQPLDTDLCGTDDLYKEFDTQKTKSRYGIDDLKREYGDLYSRERYGNEDELKKEFERPISKDIYGTEDLSKDFDKPKRIGRYDSGDLTEDFDRPLSKDRYGTDALLKDLDLPKRKSRFGTEDLSKDYEGLYNKERYGNEELGKEYDRPMRRSWYGTDDLLKDIDRPKRKSWYGNDDLTSDFERPLPMDRYGNNDYMEEFDRPIRKSRYSTEDLMKDYEKPKRKNRYDNDESLKDLDSPFSMSRFQTDDLLKDYERPVRKDRYGTNNLHGEYDRPSYKSRYSTDNLTEDNHRPSYRSRYGSDNLTEDNDRPSYRSRYGSDNLTEDNDRPSYRSRYGSDNLTEDNDRPSYRSRYGSDNLTEDIDRPSYRSRYGSDNLAEDIDVPPIKSRYGDDDVPKGDDSDSVPMRRGSMSLAEYQPIEMDGTTMNRPYIDRLTKYVPPRMPIDKPDMVVLSPESVELAWKQAREVESIRLTSNLTYAIEVRNPPNFDWRELVSGLKTRSHVIDNLHPRIDYVFRVKAWNNYGASEPSLPVSLYRPKDYYSDEEDDEEWEREFEARFGCQEEVDDEPPIEQVPPKLPMDTPEIVTQTPDSIWFEWQPARIPAYATKTPISYVVEIKEPPCTQWKRDVSGLVDTKYVREGLSPTQDYQIRVRAESEFGISEPTLPIIIQRSRGSRPGSRLSSMERDEIALSSSYIENITTGVPPRMSSTRPISTNSRPDGLTLSWNACRVPTYVKKSSISYIIEKREPPGHIWSPFAKDIKETKYNITGLNPDQDYMFRVRARNDFGTSDASLPLTIYRERDDYVPQRIRSRSGSRDSIQVVMNRRRSISVDYASSVKSEEDVDVDSNLPDKTPFQPEYLTTTYDTQYGVDGRKGKISLKVKAHPMPNVHWYFGEEKLKYGDRYNTFITPQGQITLEINNVAPDCVGEYKCYAENASGAAVKVIKFVMAEPPTVLEPLEDRLVNAYQDIMLKCRVDIPLESTIKWMKDWRPLADSTRIQKTHTKPDTYTLQISNAVPSDSGVYSCLIENQAGKVTLTSRLTVEEDVPVIPEVNLRTAAIEDYYHVLEEIGRGQHGVVRRVVEMSTGKSYAANFMYMRSRAQKNFFLSEFESLRSIIHVNGVLHLHDAFETDRSLIFVTEILTGPELLPQMVADGNWTEAKVASVVKKLLTIVKEIHAAEILHLDIKPSNIRLCGPENADVKLINFALSRFLHPEEDITHNYGSVGYASPEQINNDVINRKTDMWAVGVLAYVLLSGSLPFKGENDADILKASMEVSWNFGEKLFDNMTQEAKDFISKLLIKNKKERMSVDNCLSHPWLSTQSATVVNTDNIKQYYNMDKLKREANRLYTTAHLQSLMKIQHGTAALYQPAIDVDSGEIIFPDSDDFGDYLDEDAWLEWQLQYQDDPDSQEFKIQDKKFTVRECKHTAAGPKPHEDKDREPECESLCFVNKIQTTSFETGDDVVLTCTVMSKKEPPVVTWYRDETLLNDAYRTECEFDETTGIAVLTVTNAKDYDSGVYKCVARNKDGRVTCQARLLLGEKPGQPGRPVVTQVSGNEAFLTWMGPLTDGNSYILGYRIDYRKQGEDLWTRGPYVTEEYGIVSGLVPNTGYVFRVSCHNKYGTSPYSWASLEATTLDEDAPKVSIGVELQPLMQFTTFSKQQLILPAESRRPSLTELKEEVKLQQASPEDSFVLGDVLSKGSYGEYRKCTEKTTNKPYVMKVVPYSEEKHDSATREFEFLRKLHQSHIISVSDSYISQDSFYIVFEHLSGMNILQYLCLRKSYRETLVATVVTQILDALQYLHHLDIAHCNLQPSSIVMATLRRPYVKLRDFTYAQNIATSQQKLPMAGYPDFIAPEVIRNEPAGFCPDMWALGTLTFILLSGVSPFAGNKLKDTLSNILFDRFCMSDLYDNVTKDSIKFVSKLLKRLPKNRATIGQCLKARWLQLSDSMLKAKNNASFSTERLRDYSKVYLQRRYDPEYMNLADVVITELPRPTTGPAVQPILSDRVVNRHVVNIRVSKSKSKSASPVKQVKKSKMSLSQKSNQDDLFKIASEDTVASNEQIFTENIQADAMEVTELISCKQENEQVLHEQSHHSVDNSLPASEDKFTEEDFEKLKGSKTEPNGKYENSDQPFLENTCVTKTVDKQQKDIKPAKTHTEDKEAKFDSLCENNGKDNEGNNKPDNMKTGDKGNENALLEIEDKASIKINDAESQKKTQRSERNEMSVPRNIDRDVEKIDKDEIDTTQQESLFDTESATEKHEKESNVIAENKMHQTKTLGYEIEETSMKESENKEQSPSDKISKDIEVEEKYAKQEQETATNLKEKKEKKNVENVLTEPTDTNSRSKGNCLAEIQTGSHDIAEISIPEKLQNERQEADKLSPKDDKTEKQTKQTTSSKPDQETNIKDKSSKKDKNNSKKKSTSDKEKQKVKTEESKMKNEQSTDKQKLNQIPKEEFETTLETTSTKEIAEIEVDKESAKKQESDTNTDEKSLYEPKLVKKETHQSKDCITDTESKNSQESKQIENIIENDFKEIQTDEGKTKKQVLKENYENEQALVKENILETEADVLSDQNINENIQDDACKGKIQKKFVEDCLDEDVQKEEDKSVITKLSVKDSITVEKIDSTEDQNQQIKTEEHSGLNVYDEDTANECEQNKLKEVEKECLAETAQQDKKGIEDISLPKPFEIEEFAQSMETKLLEATESTLNKDKANKQNDISECAEAENISSISVSNETSEHMCTAQEIQLMKVGELSEKEQNVIEEQTENLSIKQEQNEEKSLSDNSHEKVVESGSLLKKDTLDDTVSVIDNDVSDINSDEIETKTVNDEHNESDNIDSKLTGELIETRSECSGESKVNPIDDCDNLTNTNDANMSEGIEEISKRTVEKAIQESLNQLKKELLTKSLILEESEPANKVKSTEVDDQSCTKQLDNMVSGDEVEGNDCASNNSQDDKTKQSEESLQESICSIDDETVMKFKGIESINDKVSDQTEVPIEEDMIQPTIKQNEESALQIIDTLESSLLEKLAEKKANEITSEAMEDLSVALRKRENFIEENKVVKNFVGQTNEQNESDNSFTQNSVESTKASEMLQESSTEVQDSSIEKLCSDSKTESIERNKPNENDNDNLPISVCDMESKQDSNKDDELLDKDHSENTCEDIKQIYEINDNVIGADDESKVSEDRLKELEVKDVDSAVANLNNISPQEQGNMRSGESELIQTQENENDNGTSKKDEIENVCNDNINLNNDDQKNENVIAADNKLKDNDERMEEKGQTENADANAMDISERENSIGPGESESENIPTQVNISESQSMDKNESEVPGDDLKSSVEKENNIENIIEEENDEEPDEEDIARQMAERAILEDAMLFC